MCNKEENNFLLWLLWLGNYNQLCILCLGNIIQYGYFGCLIIEEKITTMSG